MVLSLHTLLHPARGGTAILAVAVFALGVAVGAGIGPELSGRKAAANTSPEGAPPVAGSNERLQTIRAGHAVQVLRVLDGDTFEARVMVWPGIDITTKVRLRGIDAPELRARCADEQAKAQAARDALIALLAEGAVGISRVTLTSMAAGLSPMRPRARPPMSRRPCCTRAMPAATKADGARAGAEPDDAKKSGRRRTESD